MTTPNEARPAETGEWVLVPREPTEAMVKAASDEVNMRDADYERGVWRMMLAATPTPEPVDLGADAERGAVDACEQTVNPVGKTG